jgi:hypothetical protein
MEKVTRAKMKGGLGVIKLRVKNEALLLKNLHNFFNKVDLPWVHLVWSQYYSNGKLPSSTPKGSSWWRFMLRIIDQYKGIAYGVAGTEDTIMFWKYLWNGSILQHSYPQLLSFSKDENISVLSVRQHEYLEELFNIPLSEEVLINSVNWKYLYSHWISIITLILGHISGVRKFFIEEML